MFERDFWLYQDWFNSKKNPNNICKKVDGRLVTVFYKNGAYTAVYDGRFSPKYTSRSEAQEAAYELVTGMPYQPPAPPRRKTLKEIRREKAYRTLGLEIGADANEIQKAFRRLISLHHSDHGGTDSKARELIEARDVLNA